jgi:hypothetical protein
MIHTKRVIFMILPLLFVPLVYGISSTPGSCAAPNVAPTGAQCWTYPLSDSPGNYITTCCWTEVGAEGIEIEYCQHCDYDPSTGTHSGCGEAHPVGAQQPTPTPPTFGRLPPGVLGDLPTLEQLPTTPPPLFGRNVESIQPTESIEQPPTTTPTAPPIFGRNNPQGGFEVLQESETPPMFGQVTPQVAPLTAENAPLGFLGQEPAEMTTPTPTPAPGPPTGGGVLQEPEEEEQSDEPEDEGQEEPDQEQETAGPLT